MFAEGNGVPSSLTCDVCGGALIETAREKHPRLPAHEIRAYACYGCGAQAQMSAPTPFQPGAP